jgi:uncharacterized damage-inducible protein DinB
MSVFTNPAGAAPEHARAYIDAILGLLGGQDPLEALRATPAALETAVEACPPSLRRAPEAQGKWSVADVVHHLADSEIVWAARVRKALAEDRPTLTGFDQDIWADGLRYRDREPGPSMAAFAALRRANLELLEGCDDDALGRVALHVERGEESVRHMMRLYAGHDLLHLEQIARIHRAVSG